MSTSARGKTIALVLVWALLALVQARVAAAETRRVAVVVGHNAGGADERPLRYAEGDASKMADVLVELGDVEPAHLFLLRGRGRQEVVEALGRAAAAVKAVRRGPEDRVVLLFFYSGHSNAGALQLGDTVLTYSELKRLLIATGAEVRLTLVDGCKSGGLVATKGGKPGPAFEIGLTDQLSSVGEATLTSSAADEASLESSEIRGSFFTHHLVSGLRGAADSSGDGRVTLTEAYEYAFNRTVVASAATGSAPQHPGYDYQLSGGGELILTRVSGHSGSLRLPAGFSRALVINVVRDQVIAELMRDKQRAVAVAPGEYAVRLWKGEAAFVGRVKAPANAVTEVTWAQLAPAAQLARTGKGGGESGVTAAPLEESHRVLLENALETRRMRERLDALAVQARPVVRLEKPTWDQRGEDVTAARDRTIAAVDWASLARAKGKGRAQGSAAGEAPSSAAVLDDELDARYARYGRTLSPQAQRQWDHAVLTVRPAHARVLADGESENVENVEMELYIGREGVSRPGRRQVDLREFLRRAGRNDLAEDMSSRQVLRVGLGLGGVALALGGLYYGFSGEDCAADDYSCDVDGAFRSVGATSLLLAGAGLAVLSGILPSRVPPPHVVHEVADRYNRELRGKLSAASSRPPSSQPVPVIPRSVPLSAPPAASRPVSLRLVPVATPAGGGLFVVGQF